jgi:hypothetical protein
VWDATAGFTQNGTSAKTHVTPQRYSGKISLLAIPGEESTLLPYPNNYIVYTSVSVQDEGEATSYCIRGLFNFNVVNLEVSDTITASNRIILFALQEEMHFTLRRMMWFKLR